MPKKKKTWLTEKEIESYRQILIDKKTRILGDVAQIEKETLHNSQRDFAGDLSGWKLHMADAGTDAAEQEMLLGLASTEQKMIDKINHALERIDLGTYGMCELSGSKISRARLDAIPEATVCIKCMNKYNL